MIGTGLVCILTRSHSLVMSLGKNPSTEVVSLCHGQGASIHRANPRWCRRSILAPPTPSYRPGSSGFLQPRHWQGFVGQQATTSLFGLSSPPRICHNETIVSL